jgi:C-terminal of Roc, COR, domain
VSQNRAALQHRFFLTERSLYLLLLDDRRPDDRTYEGLLKTIRNRGGDSPIIVAINKSDNGKQDLRLDEKGLREAYPNIVAFLRTSCEKGEWAANSIAALRQKIVEIINDDSRLKHVRDPIPSNWLEIKNLVSKMAKERSVLPDADFVAFCENPPAGVEKVADANEQRALLQLLHQLGVIVTHGLSRDSSAASREITLLDPNWLTKAIYRVLEMAKSNEYDGEFSRAKLSEWLDPNVYPSRWHEFILMMMQDPSVGLCFRLPDQGEERYLIPEALPPGAPDRRHGSEDPLRFRYRYGFLPTGLIPRFIVQSHRNLAGRRSRWKQGVELAAAGCDMLIVADLEDRRVDIEVVGPSTLRRSALNIVLNDLDAVHRLNPEAEPVALVPLPDNPKEQVRYEHLLVLERERGPDYPYFPDGATHEYKVSELLDGVRRDLARPREEPKREPASPVVILVHGIRTMALWQNAIQSTLRSDGFVVQPTNYLYFDALRFLFPGPFFRRAAVDNVERQIRHTIAQNNGAHCSLIAHSFGTYVVSRILRERTDLEFDRIIFCGSVVPQSFRFEDYSKRFKAPLVNEVGTRDFWPAIAESVTFGYGSAGAYGFRRPAVQDRWHNGMAHSDFLNAEFCRKYWLPFLRDGTFVEDPEAAEPPPWWLRVVSILKIRWFVVLGLLVCAYYVWRTHAG